MLLMFLRRLYYSMFKLAGEQEDEYFSAESDDNMASLDADTEANLEQQLNRNLQAIVKKYANYVVFSPL